MQRASITILLALAIASPALSTCEVRSWNQKWFESDAIHYAAADLDGDGVAEIISASSTAVTYRRPPTFTPATLYTSTAIGALATGDVTSDGHPDLVIARTDSRTLVVLPGNGDATFGAPLISSLDVSPAALVLGNFSGDSNTDVALIGSGSLLVFLTGDGAGTLSLAGTVDIAASPLHLASADFNNDGYDDVAVSYSGTSSVQIVYANGNGEAASMVSINGGMSALLAVSDLDQDGDADLLTMRPDENRLDTFQNSDGVLASASVHLLNSLGEAPRSMVVGDIDGDLDPDVMLLRQGQYEAVFGAAGTSWDFGGYDYLYPYDQKNDGSSAAIADFTGDGLLDIVVESGNSGGGLLLANVCGSAMTFWSGHLKISTGQVLSGKAYVWGSSDKPAPAGSVTVKWGEWSQTKPLTPHAKQPFGVAGFEIGGLPPGLHELLLEYAGDAQHTAVEGTAYARVTNETTTTTLTGPKEWIYGDFPQFMATVTSSSGEVPTGTITFRVDGNTVDSGEPPTAVWDKHILIPAGSRTVTAGLSSSYTHPLSTDSTEVMVRKASSTLALQHGLVSREGDDAWIEGWISPQFDSAVVSGSGTLMQGATTLAATSAYGTYKGASVQFWVTGLATGKHTLTMAYDDDANVEGSSLEIEHTVVPSNTAVYIAAAANEYGVRLDLVRPRTSSGTLRRRTIGGAWTFLAYPYAYHHDLNVIPGTVYQYRLDDDSTGAHSNVETVYVGAFTDSDPAGKVVKQIHFTELQTAVNAFRAMAGLPPLQIDFTGLVRASHIAQIRNAINEARVALGMPAYLFGDAPVAGSTLIRAVDMLQLRDALR